jgi:murein DD-endopeptidase MepM/ murein hydrolase activator NlpD
MAMAPPPFRSPIQVGSWVFTSPFGPRVNPVTHQEQVHDGLDIGVPTGTPVVAAAPGKVVTASYSDVNGNWVKIDHGGGWATAYLHLSQLQVQPGQMLQTGDPVGLSGATGRATGPHLHFMVYQDGQPIDPKPLVGWATALVAAGASVATSPYLWPSVGVAAILLLAAAWRRRSS